MYIDVYRRISKYIDVHRRTSTYIDIHRRISTYIDVYRRISEYIDVYRLTSTYIDIHRRISVIYRGLSTYIEVYQRIRLPKIADEGPTIFKQDVPRCRPGAGWRVRRRVNRSPHRHRAAAFRARAKASPPSLRGRARRIHSRRAPHLNRAPPSQPQFSEQNEI